MRYETRELLCGGAEVVFAVVIVCGFIEGVFSQGKRWFLVYCCNVSDMWCSIV